MPNTATPTRTADQIRADIAAVAEGFIHPAVYTADYTWNAGIRDTIDRLAAELPTPAAHTPEPQWVSGGPGKSAYTDYRWECGCGHRYDNPGSTGVNVLHYAHLAGVTPPA